MISPIINPSFESVVRGLATDLPSAILLSGNDGIGLTTVAKHIAKSHGEITMIEPIYLSEKSTQTQISVEAVRDLYVQTRSRSAKTMIVVINDIDKMTLSAQDAFLKLLEEPNDSTKFILLSHHPEAPRPTILSRVQRFYVPKLTNEQSLKMLEQTSGVNTTKQKQILFIANGLPAEISRLTHDERYFERVSKEVQLAKRLIESSSYDKLAIIMSELPQDRTVVLSIVERAIELLRLKPTEASLKRISSLLAARPIIAHGGSLKLQLARSMLQ